MRFSRITSLLAGVALCAAFTVGGAQANSNKATAGLTIFAGSSMTTVLPEIDSGNTYSFGSSTALGTQIKNGAPADVLMSANTTVPASLYAAGVVEKPVNFMVGIRGKSFSLADLASAGVRRVSLSTSLYRAAMAGVAAAGREVREHGTFTYLDVIMTGAELGRYLRPTAPPS